MLLYPCDSIGLSCIVGLEEAVSFPGSGSFFVSGLGIISFVVLWMSWDGPACDGNHVQKAMCPIAGLVIVKDNTALFAEQFELSELLFTYVHTACSNKRALRRFCASKNRWTSTMPPRPVRKSVTSF